MRASLKSSLLLSGLILTAASFASAATCELTIDRTPCPGKETEARKPYAGKNPTTEKSKATTADACIADAEKNVKIVRKGTLSKKVATAMFDGKEVGKKEDSAACAK